MNDKFISTMVCAKCISNVYLNAPPVDGRSKGTCSFCERASLVVPLRHVVGAVDTALTFLARPTSAEVVGSMSLSGTRSRGRTIQSLLDANLPGTRTTVRCAVASELLRLGAQRTSPDATVAWAAGARYSVGSVPLSEQEVEVKWQEFQLLVSNGSRFFNEDAKWFLDELFASVHRVQGQGFVNTSPVRMLVAGVEIYRARQAKTSEVSKRIDASPSTELSAPSPQLARVGRMNADRVPVFYGAFSSATCVAELRPPIGGIVHVGTFRVARPLRVLDFPVLDGSKGASISIWDPAYKRRAVMRALLARLHDRIRRPVKPGDEHDYLSTQMVAEYLSARHGIDAIIFGSAQDKTGQNVVILRAALGRYAEPSGWSEGFPLEYIDGSSRKVVVTGIAYTTEAASD
jgi:hypothetical protein